MRYQIKFLKKQAKLNIDHSWKRNFDKKNINSKYEIDDDIEVDFSIGDKVIHTHFGVGFTSYRIFANDIELAIKFVHHLV